MSFFRHIAGSIFHGDVDLKDCVRPRGSGVGFCRRRSATFISDENQVHDFIDLLVSPYFKTSTLTPTGSAVLRPGTLIR